MYERYVKRVLDILISAVSLIVLSPLLLLIAIAIKLDSRGPVIFSQKRYGRNKELFDIYKFRTMRTDTPHDVPTNDLKGAKSFITPLGGFLRKTSLDELPQLWNILKGDMSLVGPRPALPREVAQYDEHARQRLAVTPGLTCYWQIQPKRNSLSFEKWLELDLKYIEERSLLVDWRIMFGTISAVVHMEGE